MRVFNSRFIVIMLDVYDVVNVVAVIDKMNPVSRHWKMLSASQTFCLRRGKNAMIWIRSPGV